MQISNLIQQYGSSVKNGEPMTGAKGVEKLVSSVSELSKGMIFEGTVNAVKGGQVRLALSNGQQITARLSGRFSFEKGQSVFFQVKSNDGFTVEIRPYTVDGTGANLTLMDALKAAGLSVDAANLSMVNKMMEEQMPIDKNSLMSMYQLAQSNPDVNISTLVELKKLGLEVSMQNAIQYENYLGDKQAISNAMESFFQELPNTLAAEELSMYKLAAQSRDILSIITDGLSENTNISDLQDDLAQYKTLVLENDILAKTFKVDENIFEKTGGDENLVDSLANNKTSTIGKVENTVPIDTNKEANLIIGEHDVENYKGEVPVSENDININKQLKVMPNTLGEILNEEQLSSLNEQIKKLLPYLPENDVVMCMKESSVVSVLNDIKNLLENTPADSSSLRQLFQGEAFRLMIKNALEQQWMIKPHELTKNEKKIDALYEKIEQQLTKMENVMKSAGVQNSNAAALAENIRGNVEFINQINEAYTYVQVPLKMNSQNASGQLYVYTNKKNIEDPERELSAFLHLDLDNLGSTDVSVRMLHKKVTTSFYMETDESYELVKQFLPVLEDRLKQKGYSCDFNVSNESKHVNFIQDFVKKDMPSTGQVHRYSFDMRA